MGCAFPWAGAHGYSLLAASRPWNIARGEPSNFGGLGNNPAGVTENRRGREAPVKTAEHTPEPPEGPAERDPQSA